MDIQCPECALLTAQFDASVEAYIEVSSQLRKSAGTLTDTESSKLHLEVSARQTNRDAAKQFLDQHKYTHTFSAEDRAGGAATAE
jgi:hypothetical protein